MTHNGKKVVSPMRKLIQDQWNGEPHYQTTDDQIANQLIITTKYIQTASELFSIHVSDVTTRQTCRCVEQRLDALRMMGTGRETVRQFKMRKLQYVGHPIRRNTAELQLLDGNTRGRRSRGRQRTTCITDLTNSTGTKYYTLRRKKIE